MSKKNKGSAKPLKNKRPKQEELDVTGPGVEVCKDKKLIALGDEYIDTRDEKAALATKLTELDASMQTRMAEIGVEVFRFSDQIVTLKKGATHVKIKTVKASTVEEEVQQGAPSDQTEGE